MLSYNLQDTFNLKIYIDNRSFFQKVSKLIQGRKVKNETETAIYGVGSPDVKEVLSQANDNPDPVP